MATMAIRMRALSHCLIGLMTGIMMVIMVTMVTTLMRITATIPPTITVRHSQSIRMARSFVCHRISLLALPPVVVVVRVLMLIMLFIVGLAFGLLHSSSGLVAC